MSIDLTAESRSLYMRNRLAQVLDIFPITQSSLAKEVGLDSPTMSRIVNDVRRPPLDIAIALTAALRKRLGELTVEELWGPAEETANTEKGDHGSSGDGKS